MYLSALLRKKGKLYESLRNRYPELLKHLEKRLKERKCPFCGRKFKTKYALFKHLYKSSCALSLISLIDYIKKGEKEKELLRVLA